MCVLCVAITRVDGPYDRDCGFEGSCFTCDLHAQSPNYDVSIIV